MNLGRTASRLSMKSVWVASLLFGCAATLAATDADRTQANSYDNAWKTAWVTHLRNVLTAQGGSHTAGFVIHIGDSITYANQYANHFAAAAGHSNATDAAIITWSKAGFSDTSTPNPNDKNGWNLAKYDHPATNRSYTAQSGITSGQWLAGGGTYGIASGNTTTPDPNPIDTLIANSSILPYPSGSKVAIVSDAQVVIIMLGTNDIKTSVATATIKANLQSIINKFLAANIMVVLSTIPPNQTYNAAAIALNTEITNLAQTNNLPLIDFYAEILRREPGTSWLGTEIQASDGTHPTYGTGAYIDPDLDATVLDNDGYELRGFLSIQKLYEVKHYVIDGFTPPGGGPTITTQPTSATVTLGGTVTLSVAVTSTGTPTYQWTKVGTGAIGGATASSLTFNPAAAGDDADYFVTITDSTGATVSNTVHLTVTIPAPTITGQPANFTVNQNQTATFSVTATGTSLSYQWHKVAGGTVGTNSSTLTLTNVQGSAAGQYYVVVSNGGGSVTSNNATLTVNLIPTISTQPVGVTVTQGSSFTLSVTAAGTAPLTYQWYQGSSPVGTNLSSYTVGSSTTGDSGNYKVTITNAAGSVTSNIVTVTVNVPGGPTINSQPTSQTVLAGATATFTVGATGVGTLSYAWHFSSSTVGTSATLSIPNAQVANAGTYTVTVTDSNGSTTSNPVSLTVTTGGNPVTLNVAAINLAAPIGSTSSVTTTVTVTNHTGSTVTVTPSSSVTFLTTGGAVTIPAGSAVTVSLVGDPAGLSGSNGGSVTFTDSLGGSQTVPVSFTIGVGAGLKKRSCAISQSANADGLMWLFGLVTLAGLAVAMRKL